MQTQDAGQKPKTTQSAAIETMVQGFLSNPSQNSQADRAGSEAWLGVLQKSTENWTKEDWEALDAKVRERLWNHPSFPDILQIIHGKTGS